MLNKGFLLVCILRLLSVVGLTGSLSAHAITVDLEVAVADGIMASDEPGAITAELRWLGEDLVVPLKRDATGVWRAKVDGPQVRALGIELWRKDGTRPIRVSQGLEILSVGDQTLSWSLGGPQSVEAWRLSRAVLSSELRTSEEQRSMVSAGWLFLSVLLVLWIARRAIATPRPSPHRAPLTWWKECILWFVFAVAWTWPAALAGPDIVGLHFDALGTVWVIDAAHRLGFALRDAFTVWPIGVTYSAIDSWVLLPLAWMGAKLNAALVHGWIQVVGVAVSAFAASRFAREVGARSPYDLLAGLCFMGSGLTAAALLEGHVYQVFNPWMPLMGMYLWRCSQPDANIKHGVAAGVFFACSLFTSGYIGLAAGLMGLGLGLPSLFRSHSRIPVACSGLIAVVVGYFYIDLFAAAHTPGAANASTEALRKGSLALTSMGPPSMEVDRAGHSWALAISSSMVALAIVAWRLRTAGARRLLFVAVTTIFIAMGPEWALGLSPDEPMITSPLAPLWEIPAVEFLRWPGRLMWSALLVLAVLAAVGLTQIAGRLGHRTGVGLLVLLVLEAFIMVGLPFRQSTISGEIPEVYQEDSGAVYDLVGQGINQSAEIDSWVNATLCQYQTVHSRSISKDCVRCRTGSSRDLSEDCAPEGSARADLNRWITSRLYEGNVEAVMTRLRSLNFTSLAVHLDWIRKSDRMRLQHSLSSLNPLIETDIGEGLYMYAIDPDGVDVDLPEGMPSGLVGPVSDIEEWTVRADLVLPAELRRGRFFLVVGDHPPFELRFMGGMVANVNDGAIYAGHFNGPVEDEVNVRLYRVLQGQSSTLWEGPVVPLDLPEDLLTFYLESETEARPMLRSLDAFSPELRHRGGKIIGLGWAGILVLLLMWCVGVRRFDG